MKTFKKFLLFCFAFLVLYRVCQHQTDGFSRARIESNLSSRPEWETACPETIKTIFNQPFTYLGCGAQTFAFASQDGQYVIKFYRHHRAGHPLSYLAPFLPTVLKERLEQTIQRRKNKRLRDFSSYKLAYDRLLNETGLICIHLNKTNQLGQKVKLYDKIGIEHLIDLDQTEFLLQKKAVPVYQALEQWIEEGSLETAELGLSDLVALLRSRCQKGIFDKDPDLKTNFGFIGTTPIQYDVGRFSEDPSRSDPAVYQDELLRVTENLRKWLDGKSTRLSSYLDNEVRKPC